MMLEVAKSYVLGGHIESFSGIKTFTQRRVACAGESGVEMSSPFDSRLWRKYRDIYI